MDWRVFLTTFGILFMAELGDKTQLAVIAMTAQTRKPLGVFWGAVAALALATRLGVAFGHLAHQWVRVDVLRKAAATIFMVLGVLMFFGKFLSTYRQFVTGIVVRVTERPGKITGRQ